MMEYPSFPQMFPGVAQTRAAMKNFLVHLSLVVIDDSEITSTVDEGEQDKLLK